jgi:hypothetical protein
VQWQAVYIGETAGAGTLGQPFLEDAATVMSQVALIARPGQARQTGTNAAVRVGNGVAQSGEGVLVWRFADGHLGGC